MAGPCLIIVSPAAITDSGRNAIIGVIDGMSDDDAKVDSRGDFRIGGRPFGVVYGTGIDDAPFDPNLPTDGSIGLVPMGQINLVACCNSQSDHVLLAALAARLASFVSGVIWIDATVAFDANSVTGTLAGRRSMPELGEFCTPTLVRHWLGNDDFRLPK